MSKQDKKNIAKVIRLLRQAADIAERLELTMGNGGYVDSLVGSMADELEVTHIEAR